MNPRALQSRPALSLVVINRTAGDSSDHDGFWGGDYLPVKSRGLASQRKLRRMQCPRPYDVGLLHWDPGRFLTVQVTKAVPYTKYGTCDTIINLW